MQNCEGVAIQKTFETFNIYYSLQIHHQSPLEDTTTLGYCKSRAEKRCRQYQHQYENQHEDPTFDQCLTEFAFSRVADLFNCSFTDAGNKTQCLLNAHSVNKSSNILYELNGYFIKLKKTFVIN